MNSIINAAGTVSAAIWGKGEGEEPPHEEVPDAPSTSNPPYDPGNSVDTAVASASPTSPVGPETPAVESKAATAEATTADDAVPPAIPAPGNAEQDVAAPTEGAGPTATEESTAPTTETETTAGTTKKAEPAVVPTAAAENAGALPEDQVKKDSATSKKEAPSGAAAAAAGVGTPKSKRSDSPASSTPGSGRKLKDRIKEKLHIGSGKNSREGSVEPGK